MPITGYYGGYLNALSTISGVEEANNRIAARNQQMQQQAITRPATLYWGGPSPTRTPDDDLKLRVWR